jgi:hypothetical protein
MPTSTEDILVKITDEQTINIRMSESIVSSVQWNNIIGRPNSLPADIDASVADRHTFTEDLDLNCFRVDKP